MATYLQMMKAVVGSIKDNGSSNLVFGLTNGNGQVLMKSSYSRELGMDPSTLVATLNEELAAGRMPQDLREKLVAAMNSVPNPQPPNPANQLRRVQIAVFLTMASPEYLIQK